MISASKLRNGVTFVDSGQPFRVMKYKHTHLSRGAGTIKLTCRNLETGRLESKTYKSGHQVEDIDVYLNDLQYLYKEEDEYVFMDPDSFEQVRLSEVVVGESAQYLKEGDTVSVLFWDERPLDLDIPPKMDFEITEAAPGEKGDSASNVYKDATIETGVKVRVPLFINNGDIVRIDTRDGSYIERVEKRGG